MFLLHLETQGKFDEAIKLKCEGLAIEERALGKHHPQYASSIINLAGLLKAQVSFVLISQIYPFGINSQPLDTDTTGQRARRDSTCRGSSIDFHGYARRGSSEYGYIHVGACELLP